MKIVVAGANPIDWKGADEEAAKAMHGVLKNPLHRNAGKDLRVMFMVGLFPFSLINTSPERRVEFEMYEVWALFHEQSSFITSEILRRLEIFSESV